MLKKVCKTSTPRFDPGRRLHPKPSQTLENTLFTATLPIWERLPFDGKKRHLTTSTWDNLGTVNSTLEVRA